MIWNWLYQLRLTSRVSFHHEWWMFIIVWAELNLLLRDECFILWLFHIFIIFNRSRNIWIEMKPLAVFFLNLKWKYRSKGTNICICEASSRFSLNVTPATEYIVCHHNCFRIVNNLGCKNTNQLNPDLISIVIRTTTYWTKDCLDQTLMFTLHLSY